MLSRNLSANSIQELLPSLNQPITSDEMAETFRQTQKRDLKETAEIKGASFQILL